MNLQDRTVTQLTEMYNSMADVLGKDRVKNAKDKPTALERLSKMQALYDEHLAQQEASKSKPKPARETKPREKGDPTYRKGYNYPLKDTVRYPRQDTLTSLVVDLLRDGATEAEIQDAMAEFTGERKEGARPMRTTIKVRQAKLVTDLHLRFGFGLSCDGNPTVEKIYIIEPQAEAE